MQEIITVGNKIDMEILINGEVVADLDKRRALSCKVMDLPDGNLVRISMPFYEGRIVPLAVGDQYLMNIFSEKGIYASRFVVVNRLKEGNLFLADMEMQEPLQKVQRREYFRLSCRLTATYRMVPAEEQKELTWEELDELEWKKGVILDISGGGVRMVSEFHEDTNLFIQIRFPLVLDGGYQEFLQYGRIIASVPNRKNPMLFEQRVEFDRIGKQEREQIIRYIFDEERKKISKEKGLSK